MTDPTRCAFDHDISPVADLAGGELVYATLRRKRALEQIEECQHCYELFVETVRYNADQPTPSSAMSPTPLGPGDPKPSSPPQPPAGADLVPAGRTTEELRKRARESLSDFINQCVVGGGPSGPAELQHGWVDRYEETVTALLQSIREEALREAARACRRIGVGADSALACHDAILSLLSEDTP